MKYIVPGFFLLLIALPLHAQDKFLDSTAMEQTLTPEEFSDVVKSVWDSVKAEVDPFEKRSKAKGEFETTPEFEARVLKQRQECVQRIQSFASEKKLNDRAFAVLMKATLVEYDADAQTYSLTTPSQILVPSRQETMSINCPQNRFVSLSETDRNGYNYSYIVLNTKPDYTWHVDALIAQRAKNDENAVYFKVWFRFDLSHPFIGNIAQLTIQPFKIALINKDNNTSYWSEDIVK
jgi:hypothetical protein